MPVSNITSAVFKPFFDDIALPIIHEGDGTNVPLIVSIKAFVNLGENENTIYISDDDADNIISVKKDGISVLYTIENNILTITPSPDVSLLELERSGDVNYSITFGNLPPSIRLVGDTLRGVLGNIPSINNIIYNFTVRASYGDFITDKLCNWETKPRDSTISWNFDSLPEPIVDSTIAPNRQIYFLGNFRRGQNINIGIDLTNIDFTELEVQNRPPNNIFLSSTRYNTLPLGISIKNNPLTIQGFLNSDVLAGDYYTELYIDEPEAPTPILVRISILGDSFNEFTAINQLNWVSGVNLPNLIEGVPSTLSVVAENNNNPVEYILAAGSRSLPDGLQLSLDGEIRGIPRNITNTQNITIRVRASSGLFVAIRDFNITVIPTFPKNEYLTITLPLSGDDKLTFKGYSEQIDWSMKFRVSDPTFLPKQEMLLINGLRDRPLDNLNYDRPFDILVGEFKSRTVYENNIAIYDVIYREVFDPLEEAGGFSVGDEVIPNTEFYPQNTDIAIVEGTINNLRKDLVHRIGLNTTPDRITTIGKNGGELLEPWMDDYISGIVVGYVSPNQGNDIIRNLTYGDLEIGSKISIGRILVTEGTLCYQYYLGEDNSFDNVVFGKPLEPFDFRINGEPPSENHSQTNEPRFTWVIREFDIIYRLEIFNGDNLLRTEMIEGDTYFYSTALQEADGIPSHINIKIYAVRNGIESDVIEDNILIRGGYGNSYGFNYGEVN